ncbi:MAG: DUF1801 domain-containing protein [Hyphomicrobiaceae bacterium]|nr:DUF1801 domain-containing protein [Hyphomicrobiaceae bacterium]MCC0023565.1 DUF1801 domain-containing protein [Hyphomicrobiaceae bacterium]
MTSVATFLDGLDHPRKPEILALCDIIRAAGPDLTEQVKWNAPSFCADGDDRITLRINPPKVLQIVFHRGAKKRDNVGFKFNDPTGLLKFAAPDRAIMAIDGADDLESKRTAITELVPLWIQAAR